MVLRAPELVAVEKAMACALAELAVLTSLAATAARGAAGGRGRAEGSGAVPAWPTSSPSSLPARCEAAFVGPVHGAYMALAAATTTHVTCEGSACAAEGPDYEELTSSLRHGLGYAPAP